jgi:stage II sporulation protein D
MRFSRAYGVARHPSRSAPLNRQRANQPHSPDLTFWQSDHPRTNPGERRRALRPAAVLLGALVAVAAGAALGPAVAGATVFARAGGHALARSIARAQAVAGGHGRGDRTSPVANRTLVIHGAGFGHGVGMSQYGAAGFALHGRDYRFILAHYYQGTSIGTVSPNTTVRVLLSPSGRPSFSGADEMLLGTGTGTGTGTARTRRLSPSVTYTVASTKGGTLRLSYVEGGRQRVTGSLTSPVAVTGPGPLTLVGRGLYDGSLTFTAAGSAGVQTVETVGLEDYVRGVLAEEMPASWPMQALEAQAVAARTYAITTDVAGQDFDLYDDARSQVYGGVDAQTPATDAAVSATADQVVTYKGFPVVTYFSASSGGHTESIQDAWPGSAPEPWLVGVTDPYDAAEHNPYHRWTVRVPLARAQTELAAYLRGDGALRAIRVLQRGTSPRIVWALVVGTRGSRKVTGPELQSALGLMSTWASFSIVANRHGKVTVRHRGRRPAQQVRKPQPEG